MEWITRTAKLIGQEQSEQLQKSHVLVIGIGGVGGHAVEHLCRAGVGEISIIDPDHIKASNINRQLLADTKSIGKLKVKLMEERIKRINPNIIINTYEFFLSEKEVPVFFHKHQFDFVIDAIDSIAPKINTLLYCLRNHINIISSMGAGGRLDPTKIKYADISETINCSLARTIRKRLHRMGVRKGIPVVFSSELVDKSSIIITEGEKNKHSTLGTISYIPAIFGSYLAAYVLQNLQKDKT